MKEMTTKEVELLLNKGKKIDIIDVRENNEIITGKIPGALNIPLGIIEFRMHELDKTREYIIVCRSGARSRVASKFLEYHGYNVIDMTGGMGSWEGIVE